MGGQQTFQERLLYDDGFLAGGIVDRLEIVDTIIGMIIVKQFIIVLEAFLYQGQMGLVAFLISGLRVGHEGVKADIGQRFTVLTDGAAWGRPLLQYEVDADDQHQKAEGKQQPGTCLGCFFFIHNIT